MIIISIQSSLSSPTMMMTKLRMLSYLSLLLVLLLLRIDHVCSFPLLIRKEPATTTTTTTADRSRPRLYSSNFNDDDDTNSLNNNDDEIRERQLRDIVLEELFLSSQEQQQPTRFSKSKNKKYSSSSFLSLSLVGQAKLPLADAAAKNTESDDNDNDDDDDNKDKKNSRKKLTVVVLAPTNNFSYSNKNGDNTSSSSSSAKSLPVLFLPLTTPIESRMKLLNQAYAERPISSMISLLISNLSLINRDGSLFDNIPWSKWSKDPLLRNRDAAGNFIDEKFSYGKRDAYNRFQGKDVNTKTVKASIRRYWEESQLASQQQQQQQHNSIDSTATNDENDDKDNDTNFDSSFSLSFLSQRVLELRIRELQMEIAEVDSQLAIARNKMMNYYNEKENTEENGDDDDDDDDDDDSSSNTEENKFQNNIDSKKQWMMQNQHDLMSLRTILEQDLKEAEKDLSSLLLSSSSSPLSSSPSPALSTTDSNGSTIFDRIAQWTAYENKEVTPPYRGATGYAPRRNDKDDDTDVSYYCSPYDLLNEILSDQLNAEVIDCVLEDTSWLGGTLVLGGAIVLRRRTTIITKNLMGETIQTPDREEDYGNEVTGGDLFVVECDVDEAIGLAISCNLPVRMERTIYERSSIMGHQIQIIDDDNVNNLSTTTSEKITKKNIKNILPYWKALDSSKSLHVEGDGNENGERLSPVSIPKTTSSLFDTIFEPKSDVDDEMASSPMFPTDNPIQSIGEYDSLTNEDKAKTLLEISNFSERLPRPRTVRNARAGENPLDKLLLPRIDESVRNEYKIRDALRLGDVNLVDELKAKRSNLQKAKEKAAAAMNEGNENLANKWDNEAQFLETLRADVTQDEGEYSRFLDRDDWYERDRQRTAKRTKKSSFGNLLDGIE